MPFALGERLIGRLPQAEAPKLPVHRQMLHAWRLGVTHPRTGEAMQWEAPLPEDFQAVLDYLKSMDW